MPDLRLPGCPQGDGRHNVTYEDLARKAEGNGRSVAETLEIVQRTVDIDRAGHVHEYTTAEPGRSR